jgi:hypothetical protein
MLVEAEAEISMVLLEPVEEQVVAVLQMLPTTEHQELQIQVAVEVVVVALVAHSILVEMVALEL